MQRSQQQLLLRLAHQIAAAGHPNSCLITDQVLASTWPLATAPACAGIGLVSTASSSSNDGSSKSSSNKASSTSMHTSIRTCVLGLRLGQHAAHEVSTARRMNAICHSRAYSSSSACSSSSATKQAHAAAAAADAGAEAASAVDPVLEAAKNLTRAIRSAATPQQLTDIIQQRRADMDHIHISAAFTCAKRLCAGDGRSTSSSSKLQELAVQELLQQLPALAAQVQQQCGPRELGNIIWACGSLLLPDIVHMLLPMLLQQHVLAQADDWSLADVMTGAVKSGCGLTPSQMQLLLSAFLQQLHSTTAQRINTVLVVAAHLKQPLLPGQLQSLLSRLLLLLPSADASVISSSLRALATLGHVVPAEQLQLLVERLLHPDVVAQCHPSDISYILWVVVTMGQTLPLRQLQALLDHYLNAGAAAGPTSISAAMWALSRSELPDQLQLRYMRPLLRRFKEVLPAVQGREMCTVLGAMASCSIYQQVQPEELQLLQERLIQQLQETAPADVMLAVWGLGKLGGRVTDSQMQQLLSRMAQDNHYAQPAGPAYLSKALWGVARLGHQLPSGQLDTLISRFTDRLDDASPRAIDTFLSAISILGHKLQPQLLQALLCQLQPVLPNAGVRSAAAVLVELSQRGVQFGEAFEQDMLQQLLIVPADAAAQTISDRIWAAARLGYRIPPEQLSGMLEQLLLQWQQEDRGQLSKAGSISRVMWVLTTAGYDVPESQLQIILHELVRRAASAQPAHISGVLEQLARRLPETCIISRGQLQSLVAAYLKQLPQATPRSIATLLGSLVTVQQQLESQGMPWQLSLGQLEQLVTAFSGQLALADVGDVSCVLSACSKLRFRPQLLLSALEDGQQHWVQQLPDAETKSITSMVWASAVLAHAGQLLPGVLLQHAAHRCASRVVGSAAGFNTQQLATMCVSAVVLDMQEHAAVVLQLASALAELWDHAQPQDRQQLYLTHTWLKDSGVPGGLSQVLGAGRLEVCAQLYREELQALANKSAAELTRKHFGKALAVLPSSVWRQAPCLLFWDSWFANVAATAAAGTKVAIEYDGQASFLRNLSEYVKLGHRNYRNRALEAAGFAVISVPFFEWERLPSEGTRRPAYLLAKQRDVEPGFAAGVKLTGGFDRWQSQPVSAGAEL